MAQDASPALETWNTPQPNKSVYVKAIQCWKQYKDVSHLPKLQVQAHYQCQVQNIITILNM